MTTRLLTVVVVLVAVLLYTVPASASDGTDLLPENTEGLLTIHNLKHLYTTLGIDELRVERPDDLQMFSDELIEDVGIDLLDPAALEAQGFDLGRPLHVGVVVDPPSVVVLVPGTGGAMDWLRAKMEEQGVRFTREQRFDGVTVEGGEADEVACFQRRDYVGIVITNHEEGGGSALETAGALIEGSGKSVTESTWYRNTMPRLPDGADATFFMGPSLRSSMSSWGRSQEDLAEYGLTEDDMDSWERELGLDQSASAVAVTMSPDRLRVDAYSWLGKDSKARDWLVVDADPVAFLRRTPSQPWLAAMSRFDLGVMWNALRPILEGTKKGEDGTSVNDAFADLKADTGVDIEADLIGQLRGNMGVLVSRASIMGTDLVVLAQVRDAGRFQSTVDALSTLLREDLERKASENQTRPQAEIVEETLDGRKVYRVSLPPTAEVVYGMVEDHFVLGSSQMRFRAIADGGNDSFIDAVGNEDVRSALLDPGGSAFYVDFRALSRDAEGILPMLGPKGVTISEVLAELSELVVTSRVDDTGVVQVSSLSSTRPGIWKYLIGLLIDEADHLERN